MKAAGDVDVRRFGHGDLSQIRQVLLDVHADAYADSTDEFDERFPWFVDHWGGNPDFACVIGYDGDEPVGFAYGAPAEEGREWWREHVEEPPEKSRTFSLSELMVRPRWRKTGTSVVLHRALLAGRDEDLSVLLVDTDTPRVQALYESWGYRKVGQRQPFPDSPMFAVMLTELPLT
ncbi:GNAT family N-acetyltransferase [Streptomyces sp. NPDC102365]|uniref:GNAT family N-acetyltransferase n=1 Tax=Streptomyces sp. NPDC102365 TaxID=3366162 RepID=UPI00382D76C5